MENDWILSEGRLKPEFTIWGGVPRHLLKLVCYDAKRMQKKKKTFALAGKPILCVEMLVDVTKLLLVKTLNVLIVTGTVIINNS